MDNNQSPDVPQQQSPTLDPYAPPSAQVAAPVYEATAQAELAPRGSRLVAQILNVLTMAPGGILIGVGASMAEDPGGMQTVGFICIALGIAALIALLVINLKLLGRQGQSLGKKWAKVRVVRMDGSPASLGRQVGLRYVVNALIGSIPFVGSIYSLVDILCIFRGDRRCIHDMIADTKVVEA